MASLQRVRVKGYSYWRIVESRRINGKPRPIVIAHLGKADDLLKRLQAAESLRLRSRSHGAVAAIHSMARELDVAGTIDRHLAASGRRDRKQPVHIPDSRRSPTLHDGLTTGQSLELASVGRACHATSKRGFAEWALTTTLGELAGVNLECLTSQHFWDQMDQLPVELIASIEREIVGRAVDRFQLSVDTALYDATNFFTFIASTNTHCKLPARGKSKQKRHDLRQLGVALLCTRHDGVPLMHQMYGGNVTDVRSFEETLPRIRQRLVELGRDLDAITLVYDKGNVSEHNQGLVDTESINNKKLHYVASLVPSNHRALIAEANPRLEPVPLDAEENVPAYRTRREIWDVERTIVVIRSETLLEGQLRGIWQHIHSAKKWLDDLVVVLQRGKQKRDTTTIRRDIEKRLQGRQHLSEVIKFDLQGTDRKPALTYRIDETALERLKRDWLGRRILMTDREDWSTAEIIRTYRGQSDIEAAFAHIKDPAHIMMRPQYHWTDQKLHVHVFTCVLSYLLARLVHLKVQKAIGYKRSMERLLDTLAEVRRVNVVRSTKTRGVRIATQLEESDPDVLELLKVLEING